MNSLSPPPCRGVCSTHVICHCLQITEAQVVEAVTALELKTVKDIRHHTGAGEGCTACHHHLREILNQHR